MGRVPIGAAEAWQILFSAPPASEITNMGRHGLDPGTREVIEHPYIVVYATRIAKRWWYSTSSTAREIASQG